MNAKVNPLLALDDDLEDEEPSARAMQVKSTKVSVPLAPRPYYALVDFCAAAAKLRGSRVTHAEVLRLLVDLLVSDAELRKRAIEQLRR